MTVDLDLTRGPDHFRSVTSISVEALRDTETFLDVRPVALLAITVDGEPLDPALLADSRYPLSLRQGPHEVHVEADMAYSRDGEGLHRTVDPADGETYLYLMTFMDAAPRCFACFDQPDLKARYRWTVFAPPGWTVLGNTSGTRDGDGRWRFAETLPLSTYLVTVVAGPYHSRTRDHDGILLGLHAKQSLAAALDADADEIFEVTGQSFDAMHALFGIRYPFGDYHQAFVPEFNAGAMETPGCVLFRDGLVFRSAVTLSEREQRVDTIVHEMAHQWFGDLVTPRWWDDLWLNESFAEYMGCRVASDATRFDGAWVDVAYTRKRWGLVADQKPSTHPVAGNGAADAHAALNDFDGISYAKGAAVLKQLAAYLGDDVFLAGIRDHLERHAYGNATLDDLLSAWERAGGAEVRTWARDWLQTSGADTLAISGDELVRTPPAQSVARPHRLVMARASTDGIVESSAVVVTEPRTPLPLRAAADEVLLLDIHDDTWAKTRLRDSDLSQLARVLPRLDPVTRGATWLGLRDAVDDAELPPMLALDLLCAALPFEDRDTGVRSLVNWGTTVLLGRVLSGDRAATATLATATRRRLDTAPAGSGLQLAAARGLIQLTDDVDLLADWYAGATPDGLTVDAELGWLLLTHLCRRGARGDDAVEARLEQDRSTEGQVHAVRCRAAMPTDAAKEVAWRVLTTDADATNYQLYAVGEGFWWPEQQVLVAPYVPRYFAEIPGTAQLRSGWVVAETATSSYPQYAVDSSTLVLADRLVSDELVHASLRRAVSDAADSTRRALRARDRFSGS